MEIRLLFETEEEESSIWERVEKLAVFNKLGSPLFEWQTTEEILKGYSLGIDPGKKGCFFVIANASGEPVFCCDMPIIKTGDKELVDVDMIATIVKYIYNKCVGRVTATLEVPIIPKPRMTPVVCKKCKETNFRPQHNAPKATAEQWVGYAYIDIVMRYSRIPTKRRLPSSWEPVVTKGVTGAGDSKFKIELASNEIFGNLPVFHGPRGGDKQDRRDAAMLAHYNRMTRVLNTEDME